MTRIALVVLDTLRKDYFDAHFGWLPGIHFENAWSQSHYTVPAHASMFTGRYPSEAGVHAKSEQFDYPGPVLPEVLKQQGFTTRSLHANPLLEARGFERGFDDEISGHMCTLNDVVTEIYGWDGNAGSIPAVFNWRAAREEVETSSNALGKLNTVARCVMDNETPTIPSLRVGARLLKKGASGKGATAIRNLIRRMDFDQDEFLFLNLMEAHTPYDPPEEYQTIDLNAHDTEPETLFKSDVDFDALNQAYDDCVRYLSDVYRDIFGLLSDDFDIVITASDHGELLGEYDIWAHWLGIYPELTHVPLTVWEDSGTSRTEDRTVGLIDVYQTVLSAAGVTQSEYETAHSRNLLGDAPGSKYLVESHGLRADDVNRWTELDATERPIEQYDRPLRGVSGPGNQYVYQTPTDERVHGDGPMESASIEVDSFMERLEIRDVDTSKQVSEPESVRSRLRDMGYLG